MTFFFKEQIDTIMEVSKVDGKFNCPECSSKLSTPTTFSAHLKKKHNGHCEAISNKTKRRSLEDNNNDNSTTISLKHRKLRSLNLNLDEIDSNSGSSGPLFSTSARCDNDMGVLLASNALDLPQTDQEKIIMLSKIGNWKSIAVSLENGKKYYMLASPDLIEDILAEQPTGVWTLPGQNTTKPSDLA